MEGRCLYFTVGNQCFKLHTENYQILCSIVPELLSNHEEANTQLLLRAKHASDQCKDIGIYSPDTDVVILWERSALK